MSARQNPHNKSSHIASQEILIALSPGLDIFVDLPEGPPPTARDCAAFNLTSNRFQLLACERALRFFCILRRPFESPGWCGSFWLVRECVVGFGSIVGGIGGPFRDGEGLVAVRNSGTDFPD